MASFRRQRVSKTFLVGTECGLQEGQLVHGLMCPPRVTLQATREQAERALPPRLLHCLFSRTPLMPVLTQSLMTSRS